MIKQAMVLSAGFGKRVRPLTLKKPKSLLDLGNQTLLSNTLKFLSNHGVEKVVINVHYLADQIIEYVSKNKFNLEIIISDEKDVILDTGGGVLNAIKNFSDNPLIIINPDTVWNRSYLKDLDLMEKLFKTEKNIQCSLLVVKKDRSFDQSFKGDFSLNMNKISRKPNNLSYVYTGLQLVKPKLFLNFETKIFSMNQVWDHLIKSNSLYGIESNIEFLHVSDFNIYKKITKKLNSQNI